MGKGTRRPTSGGEYEDGEFGATSGYTHRDHKRNQYGVRWWHRRHSETVARRHRQRSDEHRSYGFLFPFMAHRNRGYQPRRRP